MLFRGNCVYTKLFLQPELYLCTPVKVDYTKDYYIGEYET